VYGTICLVAFDPAQRFLDLVPGGQGFFMRCGLMGCCRATILYPTRPNATGTVTRLVFNG
jgi:hypothetical protein